jgi:uracil-DNA glycosylase
MTLARSAYLKEMGIAEWLARDTMTPTSLPTEPEQPMTATNPTPVTAQTEPQFQWWFFGKSAAGDEAILFKQCLRVLGLNAHEWRWHRFDGKQLLDPIATTAPDYPLVAVAFGAGAAQSLSGEKESLPQLRDIVLTLTSDTSEQAFEVPLIASFDLAHLLVRPQDKALLWNDLLLAHSVLHNL